MMADAVERSRPMTSPSAAAALDGGSEAKLRHYLSLLAKWNRVYNLTAITEPERMWTHHVLDSLSVVPVLERALAAIPSPRVLDVGSGAGLPGIPLAIVHPDWDVTMLDAIGKKTAFVQQAIAELHLRNATAVTARVEDYAGGAFTAIVSRAFSSLADFTGKTRHLLGSDGTWVAMKGAVPADELRDLASDIECVEVVPLAVTGLDAQRHALLLKVKGR